MNPRFWQQFSTDWIANCHSWRRSPLPAIPPAGDDWKATWTANPSFLDFGGRRLLYYRGTGPVAGEDRDQIGVAEVLACSSSTFDFRDLGLVVRSGGADAFDADALDPSPVIFNGQVLLFYSALGDAEDSIGLARSDDGVSFSRGSRVMPGRAPAAAVKDGELFLLSQELLPSGGYGLRLFRSATGEDFQPVTEDFVFAPEEGSWDGLSVVTARIYQAGAEFYMIYGGSADTVDEPAYFGLARSADLRTWERHPGNPIFGAGPRGSVDGGCIWFPSLAEVEDGFVMLYEGSRGTPKWGLECSICKAVLGR